MIYWSNFCRWYEDRGRAVHALLQDIEAWLDESGANEALLDRVTRALNEMEAS